ncbi:MAG TPA: hypothetical protein VLM40_18590, partial [Gemmata sp.]|nr:hypothetical protein [Gemmata sp.]
PHFEEAQMAALIQMAKLQDAEHEHDRAIARQDDAAPFWHRVYLKAEVVRAEREIADRKRRVRSLLEHAREIATEKDNPNDVTDNLLRLVYFYEQTGEPYQAAILGEHMARTLRTTGGKAATAGLLALRGYSSATSHMPNLAKAAEAAAALKEVFPLFPEIGPEVVAQREQKLAAIFAESRASDRQRAIAFAHFLDEKFPNDLATDTVRHQLASMLNEEKRLDEAFDTLLKIRPGYQAVATVRQFQGYLAAQIAAPDSKATPERKREVFRRTLTDLGKIVRPGSTATAADVRGYLTCRLWLAQLCLLQSRIDPDAERDPASRGYKRALDVAGEMIGIIPTFESLAEKDKKADVTQGLTLDGFELKLKGLDLHTRAVYLQAKALENESKIAEAAAVVRQVADAVAKSGMLYDAKLKQWAGEAGSDEETTKQKAEIARVAANVDKVRRDVVMLGFKLGALQGKADEAAKMLNILKSAGGGVEANQATLELMARELAVQIPALRKSGKEKEAKLLGDGLATLLKEFTSLKELSTSSILFLGQTFYTVAQYEEALSQLKKIKVPVPPAELKLPSGTPWWHADAAKIEDGQTRRKFQDEIRDYRFAQLYVARALRALGRISEVEKILVPAIGDDKSKGFAYASIDFRKELAYTFEAKAAACTDSKEANADWQRAIKEWSMLFRIAQARVREIKPKTESDPGTPEEEAKHIRNDFFDAYFEPQRVVVAALAQLIKDPAKLESSYSRVAKSLHDLETINKFNDAIEVEGPLGKTSSTIGAELLLPEVARRYWELIEHNPALKQAYVKAGGKFFLTKPKGID